MTEGTLAVASSIDGIGKLLQGDLAGALGSFGEATLRFFGMSQQAVAFLRTGCFVAGTPLLTPDGHRNIEDFAEGDAILSRSEFDPTGPLEVQFVEALHRRHIEIIRV